MRENIRLRRGFKIRADHGQLFSYLHQSAAPGLARIASVVVLEAVDGSPLSGAPQVTIHFHGFMFLVVIVLIHCWAYRMRMRAPRGCDVYSVHLWCVCVCIWRMYEVWWVALVYAACAQPGTSIQLTSRRHSFACLGSCSRSRSWGRSFSVPP